MAKERAETKSAGDAGASHEKVKLIANPRLNRGCRGRVIIEVDGSSHVFVTDAAKEVTREFADKATQIEVRGLQAVVQA